MNNEIVLPPRFTFSVESLWQARQSSVVCAEEVDKGMKSTTRRSQKRAEKSHAYVYPLCMESMPPPPAADLRRSVFYRISNGTHMKLKLY